LLSDWRQGLPTQDIIVKMTSKSQRVERFNMLCSKNNTLKAVASKLPWFLFGVIFGGAVALSSPGFSAVLSD
jgi:hypothetical protein